MYCEMSGNCELQNLGYRYGLDHWVYPTYASPSRSTPPTSTSSWSTTGAYVPAVHPLLRRPHRQSPWTCGSGIESMVQADTNVPFGDSTHFLRRLLPGVPHGAIFDKRGAYMGPDKDGAGPEHLQPECNWDAARRFLPAATAWCAWTETGMPR
jgi:formate dehydrogenase major subunit